MRLFSTIAVLTILSISYADSAPPCNRGHHCPPPPPVLTLTVSPPAPSLPETSPLGSYVATLNAAWSDGSPFTGSFQFTAPYNDDGGTFAIAGSTLIISPGGLGVDGDGGSVQNVSVVAVQ